MQRRSKETYRRIIQAAGRLLEKEGVAHITVQRVAEGARVDARLVRYYFDDLEGLMMVIADYAMTRWGQSLREMLSGFDDPRDAIAEVHGRFWQRMTRSDPSVRRQSLVVQEIRLGAARNEALRPLPRKLHDESEAAWIDVFESARDRFHFAIEPVVLARMIYDAWDGVTGDYLTTGDAEKARIAVEGFVQAFSATITPR